MLVSIYVDFIASMRRKIILFCHLSLNHITANVHVQSPSIHSFSIPNSIRIKPPCSLVLQEKIEEGKNNIIRM